MSGSVLLAPIVTATPAHASCILWFGCNTTPTTAPPVTSPPPPPVGPPPPAPVPPPAPPSAVSPEEAATIFFDDANAERAAVGLPALLWREDVAGMATSHSADMAAQDAIFHGSFVSDATLKALNARSVGENVGMGDTADHIHAAFMASEHHRDNILDAAFNQVGIGVVNSGGTIFVTEDFLQAKGGPVTARPKPVAHPVTSLVAAPRPVTHAVARPKVAGAATPATAPAAASAGGVVTAVPIPDQPLPEAATPVKLTPPAPPATATLNAWRAALLAALVVLGTAGGHLRFRKRRQQQA